MWIRSVQGETFPADICNLGDASAKSDSENNGAVAPGAVSSR